MEILYRALRSQFETANRVLKKYFSSVKESPCLLALGGCGQYHCCRGMRRFFPFLDSLRRVSELTDPLGQIAGYVNEQYSAADYLQALKVREIAQKKWIPCLRHLT